MKAVFIKEFGGPEYLAVTDVPDPPLPHGTDVLVRVRAAGLNRADILQRRGAYPPPAGVSPNIPGLEFAGEIIKTGEAAKRFRPGDRVFGITAGGAQAELILADESTVTSLPPGLDFVQAAAFPEVFITAHDALFTRARLCDGETLLVHAVGSGVGLAALQLASARNCRVIGTSRTKAKLERCFDLGLKSPICVGDDATFSASVLELTGGRGADVILDLVGAAYFAENLASISIRGRMMLVGLTGGSKAELNLGLMLQKRAAVIGTALRSRSISEKADAVARFAEDVVPLIEAGTVKANVDRVFAVEDIRAAHEYLESNESFGKIVIEL